MRIKVSCLTFADRRYIEKPSRPAPQPVTVSKSSYSSSSKSSSNQYSSSTASNYKVKTFQYLGNCNQNELVLPYFINI
jgi:hypothetical protein